MMYLNHDHRERENVRFLAMLSFNQYFWCSPSWGETTLTLDTPYGIRVLSHHSEAKVRDTRITRVVHEDVWLDTCQYSGGSRSRVITYSFEVPMNHIAGVEVIEALSDVG